MTFQAVLIHVCIDHQYCNSLIFKIETTIRQNNAFVLNPSYVQDLGSCACRMSGIFDEK